MYRALVIIFDTGRENKLRLYIFCYIVPFIISFLNLLPWLIKPDPNFSYHRNDTCWVNIDRKGDDGSISDQSWTYLIGFYLVLVLMLFANIAILSYGLRINLKVTLVMHAIIKTVCKNITISKSLKIDLLMTFVFLKGIRRETSENLSKSQTIDEKLYVFNVYVGNYLDFWFSDDNSVCNLHKIYITRLGIYFCYSEYIHRNIHLY